MNYFTANLVIDWNITWADQPKKQSKSESDAWKRCQFPFRKSESETSELHGESRLIQYIRAYLEKKVMPCDLRDTWRELQEKWEPYIAHLSKASVTESEEEACELADIFTSLAETWSNETGGYSTTSRRYAHPSYQAILGMGEEIVPLILKRLEECPDWWFEALTALAKPKTNPVAKAATFAQAVEAWLEWGRRNQPIK